MGSSGFFVGLGFCDEGAALVGRDVTSAYCGSSAAETAVASLFYTVTITGMLQADGDSKLTTRIKYLKATQCRTDDGSVGHRSLCQMGQQIWMGH